MSGFLDIQKFESKEKIGDKKYCAIYQIIDEQTGIFYLIERLKRTIKCSSKSQLIFFSKEANMLSKISHPSILKFLGLSNQDKPMIVTEFCSNGTLEEILKEDQSRLDATDKFKIIYGIGYSLLYLHSHNIIHCSIEPKNVMLDEKLEPKLFNFSSSRTIKGGMGGGIEEEGEGAEEGEEINILSTPRYIAPEIWREQKYTKSSDIYSYSIFIYEVISQEQAYCDIYDCYEISCKVNKGNRPPKPKQMSDELYEFLSRMWTTSPEERPSISEILKELKEKSQQFIENICEDEYQEYINQLEHSPITFDQIKDVFDLQSILNSGMKFQSDLHDEFNLNDYFSDEVDLSHVLNINDYKDNYSISKNTVIDKKSGKRYYYQSTISLFDEDNYESLIKLSFSINKATKLRHPSIVKYIGYSPMNFNHDFEPMIVTEYFQNKSLNDIIQMQRENKGLLILNDTRKLINIYGIASALSYLHSNDIIIRGFSTKSILEDDYLFPKLCNFIALEYLRPDILPSKYDSPEDVKVEKVSKKGNVYSFAMIIYEMMTNREPSFDDDDDDGIFFTPKFDDSFPVCYKQLIERCVSSKPEERPNFGEIVEELKNKPGFITEKVNKNDFQIYADFVDQNSDELFESYIKKINSNLKSENLKKIILYEKEEIEVVGDTLDLSKFRQKEMKSNALFGFDGILLEKETDKKFYVRVIKYDNAQYCHEVNFICKMSHPSILKFIGYSPNDFKENNNHVIVTEFCSNGTLEEILKKDPSRLDATNKFKIIYGIGYSLLYLHSHNIIHCSIEPKNVMLDEKLEPKLFNFSSSRTIKGREEGEEGYEGEGEEINILATPRYIAPEIWREQKYTKSSDIYSYSIFIYEVISQEQAYCDIYDCYEISCKVNKGNRPPKPKQMSDELYEFLSRMWTTSPEERPSISEILKELKEKSQQFIENICEDEYQEYINQLEHSPITFDQTKVILKFKGFNNIINKKNDQNAGQLFQLNQYMNELISHDHVLYINDYEVQKKIGQGSKTECMKIIEKLNGTEYCGKESLDEFKRDDIESIVILSYKVRELTKLEHPSICKTIGYSPLNFDNEYRPIVISELVPNCSLKYMLELGRQNKSPSSWNMTKKLMNIYGIASALSYLHSHNIIHQRFHPDNILLDEYLLPKITDIYSIFDHKNGFEIDPFDDKIRYIDPHALDDGKITEKRNVYSFGIIVFEMLSNEKFFGEEFSISSILKIYHGYMPLIPDTIPEIYQTVIECCWSNELEERPSFETIVEVIRKNFDLFICDGMNKDDIIACMKYIDNYFTNAKLEDFINLKSESFQRIKIQQKSENGLSLNIEFINLEEFKKVKYIGEGSFGVVYKIINKECGETYAAKVSKCRIDDEFEAEMINISREVNILSKLDHPSILKFIGYSPTNFEKSPHPVIITEYSSGGDLEDAIELERNSLSKEGWNETTKLIIIYGIASSFQYLHSLNIIHRDLRPGNILLDDSLFPKLADFGLSKEITDENIKSKIKSGFKGTPLYVAPEIWTDSKYTKAGDVYAFAFTVFEIMTCQKCFPDIKSVYELYTNVLLKNMRPSFEYPIENCYKKLIESCWSVNPEDRPTFDDIVHDLETNPEFITDFVDKDEFLNFIDLVHQCNNERMKHLEPNKNEIENKKTDKSNKNKKLGKSTEKIDELSDDSSRLFINNKEMQTNVQLAQKYSIENDVENTYVYMNKCINEKKTDVVLEYAVNLYKHQKFDVAKKYFKLLIKVNHPIAKYFYGIMKYYGHGCHKNLEESEIIMRDLSKSGIDLATEFVEDHFEL